MILRSVHVMVLAILMASPGHTQTTDDPFAESIGARQAALEVRIIEFATIPDSDGSAPRIMLLVDEPGTDRLFVNDMRGPLYSVSYDGKTVTPYLNLNDPTWNVNVEFSRNEQGFQSFAFHPQFGEPGTRGYGKFYTLTDTKNMAPPPDFQSGNSDNTHDTVLLEWSTNAPHESIYAGQPPRELVRFEQPFRNHNGGHLGFNPLAAPGSDDFGLLYMGNADGGSGGDPLNLSQNPMSAFGKIFRLDPMGSNSANGQYGIPSDNPFVNESRSEILGEIYALGLRNPQRFSWDPQNGNMFVADIGQNIVEEISLVTAGANLGWNVWEGSFEFISRRAVSLINRRGDSRMSYPVVEYGQLDPLLQRGSAATGVYAYRQNDIPQLTNLVLFGDNPSGEVFSFSADDLPHGGQEAIRRVLFKNGEEVRTLLQLIQAQNISQGKDPATRADMRMSIGPDRQLFILNKRDGTIRLLVPDES